VVVALGGWPGETGVSAVPFCETFRPGLVKQPANTFSNLGFVAVALLVGWQARKDFANAGAPRNRMTTAAFYPAFYAGVSAFLGPGSAAMHASTTAWGGRVDVFSMYVWAVWMCAFGWVRLTDGSPRDFLRVYVPAIVGLGAIHFAGLVPISSDILFGLLVTAIAGFEVAIHLRRPELRIERRYGVAGLGAFLLAFAIWIPSRTGGPFCDPGSILQGHAIWHLLCAGSVWFLYQQARSEHASPAE
jgi:hypothetical protein